MKTVWKYELPNPPEDRFSVDAPQGAKWLTVQNQAGQLVMWALVNPDSPKVKHHFVWAGTGHRFELTSTANHVGTIQDLQGALIWHIFCLGEH